MTEHRTEATAIARLYGRDQSKFIGLIYLWNTGELTFLWSQRKQTVYYIDPPIDQDRIDPSTGANREVLAHISSARARSVQKF